MPTIPTALESVPFIKGDNIMIPYFGGRLSFQVIDMTHTDNTFNTVADLVTRKTMFEIRDGLRCKIEDLPRWNPEELR